MRAAAVLLGFEALGYVLSRLLPWPVPDTVLGMVLLAVALNRGWIPLSWVQAGADFLLRWLALFFVPLVVAGIPVLTALGGRAAAFVAVVAVSTAAGLFTAGWVVAGGRENVAPNRTARDAEEPLGGAGR
ncbi:MAG: CidA/LrgA family protein [Firmicutes bacterium]|nr:CidA/LrgA family protein [Alicyclobacillaceae bacterium]MCL6496857.1 CidA/LrgA family protein [Bacillota bacterium]